MAVKSESEPKKILKKEEVKRERTSTETPATGKKTVKRTRASTTPTPSAITPKRRRL